jgi:hypothetical protein
MRISLCGPSVRRSSQPLDEDIVEGDLRVQAAKKVLWQRQSACWPETHSLSGRWRDQFARG